MPLMTDQRYLQTEQYRDASNLNARIAVHQRFSTNDYNWQRWVFDRLDLPWRSDILDLGCGPGSLWEENEQRVPAGWTIVLSDLSPGMLLKARQHLGKRLHRLSTCALDAQAIPLPDESFDAVIANHMLYHVPDRNRALCEMRRVLRPGGQLYTATNGSEHLRELRDLVARFCASAETTDVAAAFGLENGAEQLSRYFARVTLFRQENGLVVTEAEPLIAYARSMMSETALTEEAEAFSQAVREQIVAQGAIRIQKDSGMFKATRV